jgi:hypothetical protein
MVREAALFVLALAGALAGCGEVRDSKPDDGGASPDGSPADVTVAEPADGAGVTSDTEVVDGASAKLDVLTVDVGILKPDAQGAAGAPVVPCSGDPSVLIWDAGYTCGTCGSDAYFAVVCRDGFLACPTSFVTSTGDLVTVPSGVYVVDRADYGKASGQCASAAPASVAAFALADPVGLTTARDPALPLRLRELPSGGPSTLAFNSMFANRARGEEALRLLVVLTDMTTGAPVAYDIGQPVRDAMSGLGTLALTPATPLATNAWYRVTVYPAETQQLVACRTVSGKTSKVLAAPETTDFYTGSRPMVADMFIPDKGGGKGYFQFDFTEPLVAADLAAYPMAVVTVDGVELSGCPMPYACAGGVSAGPSAIRLDVTALPTSFTTVTLRIPHAIHSTGGGTILSGTSGNPHATVEGDLAVYTFKAADLVLTDNNSVKRWFYAGP